METISPSSNSLSSNNNNSNWTNEQNTWFESALAIFDTETPDRWSNVAAMVPGKSELDVKNQYEKLKADINKIEAGYLTCSPSFKLESDDDNDDHDFGIFIKRPTKFRSFDHERRKGVPWTEEEHRRFLMGLQVHGKGDWRSISRNFVRTKTPTQVASHAQKYYARQHADGKEKRRPSIHDITMVSLTHNPNSPERASSSSSSMITTGTHVMNNYPFEVAKINKNGGNNIRVFSSGFQYYQPTTIRF